MFKFVYKVYSIYLVDLVFLTNFAPEIVRYTFRKHATKKIKLGKVLNSKEKGISITR